MKYSLNKSVVFFMLLSLVLWLTGILIAPLLAASELSLGQGLSAFMYFFYKPVCHQISDRSFWMDGYTLAVCVRCFSFYFGGFLVISIYFFKDKISIWPMTNYLFFILPAILDFILEKFDFYTNIGGVRLLTGLLLGIAVFQLLLVSLTMKKKENKWIIKESSRPGL